MILTSYFAKVSQLPANVVPIAICGKATDWWTEKIPCMVCYEKSGDFCYRHLVADWFTSAGIQCREWTAS